MTNELRDLERERAVVLKLEEEKKHSDDLLNVVIPLGVALSGEKNLDRLLERILSEAKRLCNADAGTLYLRKDATLSFAIMATDSLGIAMGGTTGREIGFPPVPLADAAGVPNEKNVSAYAALKGSTVNIPDIYSSEGFDFSGTKTFDERNSYRSISSLTVPLKNHVNEVIGVLQLINAQDPGGWAIPFSPHQQQVVECLASLAAVALNNHLLLERQRLLLIYERDVQIGRMIQGDFLPPELPEAPGWQIAARFQPARQVAGDFYDAFFLPGGLIGLVIADVCDKGVGAALFMAIFRSLIRAFAQQHGAEAIAHEVHDARAPGAPPGFTVMKHAVELTNGYIAENHSRTNMFATIFFAVLDPVTGQLVYGNGGHEPPIVLTPEARVKSRLGTTGPAVGMMAGVEFGVVAMVLERGETLLAFTDGVTDARDAKRAFLTEARLLALVAEPAPSVAALLDRIEATLKAHIGDADPFDDITLLAVRRE